MVVVVGRGKGGGGIVGLILLGEKRWQDVGIAVCVHCPAMPPYRHFLLLNATTCVDVCS